MEGYSIAVLGGGSVGLCLAAHFAEAGARVFLLVRSTSVEKLDGQPIEVSGLLGNHLIPPDRITVCDAATPGDEVLRCDMLALTTKAYDVDAALRPFRGQNARPSILLLQNGMGSAEVARDVMGPEVPIYSSAMMIGMVRRSPARVEITAQSSPILCGSLLGQSEEPLAKMLRVSENGFIPMALDPSIRETIAFKLLFNSCMNPTGAITGQTYGDLLEDPNSRDFIVGLADETLAAYGKAYDYHPARSGRHYVDEILTNIVFPRAQGHSSSMLQDLRAGRKTEIDFLNGAIIDLAASCGLDAVRHASIRQLIKACETSKAFRLSE